MRAQVELGLDPVNFFDIYYVLHVFVINLALHN
jgi:hypothetical protein